MELETEQNASKEIPLFFIQLVVILVLATIMYVVLSVFARFSQLYIKFQTRNAKKIDQNIIYNKDECPICLNIFSLPMRTSCGHVFCGLCLLTYFQSITETLFLCPLCRNILKEVSYKNEKIKQKFDDYQVIENKLNALLRNQVCSSTKWKFSCTMIISFIIFMISIWVSYIFLVLRQ